MADLPAPISTPPQISLVVSDLAGGGAVRAFLLAQVLLHLGYGVEVVGFLYGQGLYAIPPAEISVRSIPGVPYPGFFRAVGQLVSQIRGDAIYAIKPKPSSFGVALGQRWRTGKPLLLDMDDWEMSWHGGDDWRYRVSPRQLYRDLVKPGGQLRQPDHPLYVRWLERFVPQADALTVDTSFLQRRFGGVYVANGKDTDRFNPDHFDPVASRRQYGLEGYRVLMFPGAPRPHKGVEDVLQALDQLNQPDLRLVIVGGSPYDDYDRDLQHRWGRWIVTLPRSPIEAMPEIVAAAHVVVVPQRDTLTAQAQFPLKLTDGMAMAKPVLSTMVGDIPEILGGTGYLAPPHAPDHLAEQIQAIFADWATACDRGRQARIRCVKCYSLQAMGQPLAAVLTGLGLPPPSSS